MPSVVVASRQRSLQEQFKEALALEEEIIDKQRQAEVQQIVSSAREQLRPFASTVMHPTFKPGLMGFLRPSWREMQTVYVNTGGAGHIGFSLSFALIDRDGSGELSSSELQVFEATAQAHIDSVTNSLMNVGVISALLLSMVWENSVQLDEVMDDSPFDENTIEILQYLNLICKQILLSSSLALLFVSARIYTSMTVLLPTTETRIKYMNNNKKLFSAFAYSKNMLVVLVVSFALSTLCSALICSGWKGMIALMPFVTFLAVMALVNKGDGLILHDLHAMAKDCCAVQEK